jgi:hypothetical protein
VCRRAARGLTIVNVSIYGDYAGDKQTVDRHLYRTLVYKTLYRETYRLLARLASNNWGCAALRSGKPRVVF